MRLLGTGFKVCAALWDGAVMCARCLGYCYRAGLVVLVVIVLLVAGRTRGSAAMGDGTIEIYYQDCSLSIDIQEARVSEVFQELARRTPHEFIVPEELLVHRVTLRCSGVDMDEAIRRVMSNAGVDNYALVYSLREAKSAEGPLYRVKVVLLGGDSSGADETFRERTSFGKAIERAPEVEKRQMPFPSDSFREVRQVPIPSEMPFSGEASVELAPRRGESLSEEVPTPVELSPENEGFPAYRKLENNQMPTKLQQLTPP